jgi:hypothetical protein
MLKSVLALFLLSACALCTSADRTVEISWNPDCDQDACKNPDNTTGSWVNVVYVKLKGDADIIHFVHSNIGAFTILDIKTDLSAELKINWTNLLSNNASQLKDSLSVTGGKVLELAGYEVPAFIEFNDENGSADLAQAKANETVWHCTDSLVWKKFVVTSNVSGVFEGSYGKNTNGSFRIQIRNPGNDKRDEDLPHLQLKPEGTSVEFIIDGVEPQFNLTKFAINVIYLTTQPTVSKASLSTIDDEYTPGTFKLWNAEITDANGTVHNHLQWKPIFYFATPKTLENSTITKQYDLASSNQSVSTGIGRALFPADKQYTAMNVSFGLPGNEKDGYYYKQTKYSSWTVSVGLGGAPVEHMSFLVTLVIIVGFGLPALVIVVGLIVMIARKVRNRNSDFQPL